MKTQNENQDVLSEVGCIAHGKNKSKLNFSNLDDSTTSILLQSIYCLDLTVRAKNVLNQIGVVTVGELVQLTESRLFREPNMGKTTIENCKDVLAEFGLSLGTPIENWPTKEDIFKLAESKAQIQLGAGSYIEEEISTAVRAVLNESESAIVLKRFGWDGGDSWSLEGLANNPNASKLSSPVTLERIRQIEHRALKRIEKFKFFTPKLSQAISQIEQSAPIAETNLPGFLKKHKLTQCGLSIEAMYLAMRIFNIEWGLIRCSIGYETFLLPSENAEQIEFEWNKLIHEGNRQDFVSVDEIRRSSQQILDTIELGINQIPHLKWLDLPHRVYWSLNRVNSGWNKIVNVCRKILSIVSEIPIARLLKAVHKARTVSLRPNNNILKAMLQELDDFEVNQEIVARSRGFRSVELTGSDQLMINTAKITGTVTTFLDVRTALIHQGVSTNYAHLLIAQSPLWIRTARGKYRFIANMTQMDNLLATQSKKPNSPPECESSLVELTITHRHVVTGIHRIKRDCVKQGEWSLRDKNSNLLGNITVDGNVIKGLQTVFKLASVEVGDNVVIDFSDSEYTATLFVGMFGNE